MASNNGFFTGLSRTGAALGKGVIAGFAGTVAITISQMVEMQLTNRGSSNAPMKVAKKVLGVEPKGQAALEVAENDPDSERNEEELKQKRTGKCRTIQPVPSFLIWYQLGPCTRGPGPDGSERCAGNGRSLWRHLGSSANNAARRRCF